MKKHAMTELIIGAGGGGKGGGGSARVAQEAPDSLRSKAYARVVDLISEGEIEGLVDGLQSVYLDDTPIQNPDGSTNFSGVTLETRNGSQQQSYVPGFSSVENEVVVGVEAKASQPVVRSITDPDVDAVRVKVSVPQLTNQDTTNGDLNGSTVNFAIDRQVNGGGFVEMINDTISGKTTTKYQRSYYVPLTGSGPWDRDRILQWIGIPTCIGIAQTKTLAKLANHVAKTAERKPGSYPAELAQVCNLAALPPQDLDDVLQATDVGEVWGVGRRISKQLKEHGIQTVLDLVRMDPVTVRRGWNVTLEKTVRELQGQPCVDLDDAPESKQQIACTRSFGQPVTELEPLIEAVSEFASRAGEKLRKQNSVARELLVFIHTSPHRQGPQLSRSVVVPLRRPTDDSRLLAGAAADAMRSMYLPGYRFIKAGVILVDLQPARVQQQELDLEPEQEPETARDRSRLMVAMDVINQRYGKGTLHVGSTGQTAPQRAWGMKQERRTPQYTTRLEDVPVARA